MAVITLSQRTRRVRYDGQNYDIPEIWLAGYTEAARRDGARFEEAYVKAIAHWAVQVELERLWELQHNDG